MTKNPSEENTFLEIILQPETELERQLLKHPDVRQGLMWGKPRYGHPEGAVYKHVKEVLDNIEKLQVSAEERKQLRLIALIHDTFKYKEDRHRPRNWNQHHAVLARRFMDNYTEDELVLTIIQWHDEAYYIWRDIVVHNNKERGNTRMQRLLEKLHYKTNLYYLFFYCDSKTGNKNPAPIYWIEKNLIGIHKIIESKSTQQ